MRSMRRGLLFNIFVCAFLTIAGVFFFPGKAAAAGEFRADYDVHYAISPAGITIVTQNISLTNNLTNLYPQKYSILIDSENIKNVVASDPSGVITPAIAQKDGKTEIILEFNQQVVGLGKTLQFTLRYEHGDVAQKIGRIWEVNIPGVANDPDLGRYDVTLSVPSQFGPPAYVSPLPSAERTWNRDQLTAGGISAAYGQEQIFDLSLSYFLQNSSPAAKTSEIALPPNTPYQEVSIRKITPEPDNVRRDGDGNWLASYALGAGQALDIQADITVAIRLHPKPGAVQPIIASDYTKPLPYWEVYDGKIIALAKEYKTPRDIYDYVVSRLNYSYTRVDQNPERKGAAAALASPADSVCMEFTDLFIAIARAAGIPAREAVGFAYTTNARLRPLSLVTDVLHAWPEYYDFQSGLWVPVDPTWGDTTGGVDYFTKLDFNHIVFAYHGLDSERPYPAGFYRRADKNGKDIQLSFGTQFPEIAENLEITVDMPLRLTAGIQKTGTVTVKNLTDRSVADLAITISSEEFNLFREIHQENVPPFALIRVPVIIGNTSFWSAKSGTVTVTANEKAVTRSLEIVPFYRSFLPLLFTGLPAAGLFWYASRKGWVWKFGRKKVR